LRIAALDFRVKSKYPLTFFSITTERQYRFIISPYSASMYFIFVNTAVEHMVFQINLQSIEKLHKRRLITNNETCLSLHSLLLTKELKVFASTHIMLNRIENNPHILGGKPVIKGTRIPVYLILELLQADYDFQKILDAYPALKTEDIKAALEYAAKMAKNEDIVFFEVSHAEVSH